MFFSAEAEKNHNNISEGNISLAIGKYLCEAISLAEGEYHSNEALIH